MLFSDEDEVLIKFFRQKEHLGSKALLKKFPEKNWSKGSLDTLLKKIDETGSTDRIEGSGRLRASQTEENITMVSELIMSQEDQPNIHLSLHEIEKVTGVSRSYVRRIVKEGLQLKPMKNVKGPKILQAQMDKRVQCTRRFLREMTKKKLNKTFFTDDELFRLQFPHNSQNNRFCVPADTLKKQADEEQLNIERSGFPESVMVSLGASKLGKTSVVFISDGAKINSTHYIENFLKLILPEMHSLSDSDLVFQQDGARLHNAQATTKYLDDNIQEYIKPSHWPANSPDLNPVDYGIWNELERMVFQRREIII